jgi:hypothetical protein
VAISMQELSRETAEFLPEREVMCTSCRRTCQPEPHCWPQPPPPCGDPCGGGLISVCVGANLSIGL